MTTTLIFYYIIMERDRQIKIRFDELPKEFQNLLEPHLKNFSISIANEANKNQCILEGLNILEIIMKNLYDTEKNWLPQGQNIWYVFWNKLFNYTKSEDFGRMADCFIELELPEKSSHATHKEIKDQLNYLISTKKSLVEKWLFDTEVHFTNPNVGYQDRR